MDGYEIKPVKWLSIDFRELFRYRELFFFMAWRDIKVKYKQTVLGFLWVILQPVVLMIIFTILWQRVMKLGLPDIPYPLFAYSGLIFWGLFSSGVSNAGESMITNANIVKKVYFPRLIVPSSALIVSLFDFLMTLILYFALILYYDPHILSLKLIGFLLISVCITLGSSFGLGLIVASANTRYRDFRYVVPFLLQALFFLSPVIAPLSLYGSGKIAFLLSLNPLAGAIDLSRAALSGTPADWQQTAISLFVMVVLVITGLTYFRKVESQCADLL